MPKITLTGITTILHGKRALLEIQRPPNGRTVVKPEYCILKEGQRDGPVEVLDIDEKAAKVKVDNSGTIMVITFEKPAPTPAPKPRRLAPYWSRFRVRAASR